MRSAHAVQINDLINRLNQLRNKNELEVLDKLPSLAENPMPQVVQTVQSNVGADLRAANEVQPNVGADLRAANDNSKTVIPATKTTAPVVIETQSTEQDNIEDVAIKATELADLKTSPMPPTEPTSIDQSTPQAVVSPSTEVDQSSSQDATPATPEAPVIIDEEPVAVEVKPDAETIVIETDSAVAVTADELVEPQNFELEKQTPAEIAAENAPPKPLTAQDVWHLMIQGFANHELANPQLKNYMIEATPETFDDSTLTVCFDDEYELEHYNAINDAMPLMNKLLQEVVDDWAAVINLQKRSGVRRLSDSTDEKKVVAEASADYDIIKSPMDSEISDEDEKKSLFGHEEVMAKIENNDFVKYSVDLFGGRVVDVHG
jgi:hypothetical protein